MMFRGSGSLICSLSERSSAGTDRSGQVWAGMLTGPKGFLRAPAPDVLTIDALPGEPLGDVVPGRVGMIAIEPATRRRMRLNGRAVIVDGGIRVELDQVLSNCPKYLQQRSSNAESDARDGGNGN